MDRFDIIEEIIKHKKDCTMGEDYAHTFFIWITDFIKAENEILFNANMELMKWAKTE